MLSLFVGVLEKWEVPPMNTMRKTLSKMDEKVANHDQALKAIKYAIVCEFAAQFIVVGDS